MRSRPAAIAGSVRLRMSREVFTLGDAALSSAKTSPTLLRHPCRNMSASRLVCSGFSAAKILARVSLVSPISAEVSAVE